jgi:hypothetical protein
MTVIMDETDKRLAIIPKFLTDCDTSLFVAVLLTGSMVFGKHHSVHQDSDIDIICLVKPENISQIINTKLFAAIQVNPDLVDAFAQHIIDRFWLDHTIDGIKLNIGLWSYDFFESFTELKAEYHVLGSTHADTQTVDAFTADGNTFRYDPQVKSHRGIYTKKFPLLHNGLPVSSPTYNNLVASETLYDATHTSQQTCQERIANLVRLLNTGYGDAWQKCFLEYIVARSSNDYLDTLKQRLLT